LEWFPDKQRIVVGLESKPEMPTEIILPESQVSAIVPMPKSETRAKLPVESVSSSKPGPIGVVKERELTSKQFPGKKITLEYVEKPKPKKRGRPKKSKGKS
jgi:hypothetical protein